jgi:2-iminobutanoate/2-iminopropanoate deaminase
MPASGVAALGQIWRALDALATHTHESSGLTDSPADRLTPLQAVSTPHAPAAIGPYSQAVEIDGTVYCSGQIALDPASGQLVAGGAAAETERALANLKAVLAAAGLGFEHVVKVTIYLADLADFATVNDVYARHVRAPFPARATVGVAALPRGARVEIDAVAVRPA